MVYDWSEQLRVGADGERVLDTILSHLGTLTEATRDEQRAGIDRILVTGKGQRLTIEYKTDTLAHRTGNAYIETLSVSTTGKLGWLHTCTADRMVYYTPGDRRIRVIRMDRMRKAAQDWQWVHPVVRVQNKTYYGEGMLVPLSELDAIASTRVQLPEG